MEISGGHLLVQCLQSLGASTCFGVPGESYLDVLDGLHDTQGELDFVLCRNEGGAAYMAEAYGKLTGNPGICMVTRGPGASNASVGVHTAMQNSTPMILFVGQIGTDQRDREVFQEVDYRAFFGSVAKWVVEIDHADRIPETMSRAWNTALSGRPGPVVVALPENTLSAKTQAVACKAVRIGQASPSVADINEALQLLDEAKRPLVIVGGGGWNEQGRLAIQQFCEQHHLPVCSAFRFNDLIDNHSGCYIGEAGVAMSPALKQTIQEADLVLAVGVRFGEMTTGAHTIFDCPNPTVKLIHVHASDRELGKIYAADLPIHANVNQTALMLNDATPQKGGDVSIGQQQDWPAWQANGRSRYIEAFDAPQQPGSVDMVAITAYLRETLPGDVIVTNGAGNFATWPGRFLQYGEKQRLLAPQSGTMGYGVPAAIAAKIVEPNRTVLCFAGDGDFQMNMQELGTAMQANAQPIILILNNGSYGTIRMHQERHYPSRVSATELKNPDFVALSKSYGFYAEKVRATSDFEAAFARALASNTGAVLELMIATEAITPRQTLSQIREQAQSKK